jgi:hypothetical protein
VLAIFLASLAIVPLVYLLGTRTARDATVPTAES